MGEIIEYRLSSLLAQENYIPINRILLKEADPDCAVIFGELCNESDYWHKNNGITEDGYFFSTIENIESKTNIKRKVQEKAFSKLQKLGLISVARKGLPAKRYVKINETQLASKLGLNGLQLMSETDKLESTKCTSNKNISNKNIKIFTKPTIEELQSYIEEISADISADEFYDYHEANGWLIQKGTKKMKDWKATVRTWKRNREARKAKEVKASEPKPYNAYGY